MTAPSLEKGVRRRFRKRWLFAIYAILLLASSLVRLGQGHGADPSPDQQVVTVDPCVASARLKGRVEIACMDLRKQEGETPFLLIHGSPMKSYDLRGLAESLAGQARVITPDLPGFGRSTRKVPDYSFQAHACYLDQLLDALDAGPVHVIAYSQGGGPALQLWARNPEQVRSLTLVSSIGPIEFELLGHYTLNHALHSLQLGMIWLVETLVPHFGWLDGMMLNTAYARNFQQSDQRPLRDILGRIDVPVLILQGRDDLLVPPGAAVEMHRLVPQSELELLEGGHLLALTEGERLAGRIVDFTAAVERGEGVQRASASPERIERAARPFDPSTVEAASGFAMVVLVVLIALGTLVSEDLACIAAGLLAAHGILGFLPAVVGAFIGIFFGDLLLYEAGRHIGRPAIRRAPLRWFFREEAIDQSAQWFARRGPAVVLASRFIPGSRLPTFFAAGMLHTRFWSFFGYFLAASLVWAPLLVWVAMKVGSRLIDLFETYRVVTLYALIAVVVILWLMFRLIIPLFSFKGRRMLLSRWRRLTRWEFWPMWIFYPPVLGYIAWLGVRYRGWSTFLAANPVIPYSGFIGESKRAILDAIGERDPWLARYDVIPRHLSAEEKEERVVAFLDRLGISFPVVLKPDQGQRGQGVAVVRSVHEVESYFRVARPDTLVQEYVSGSEFGLFYYRLPGRPRGRIFSITEKRFPVVVGDGVHDLEHLILKDRRAVCMAPFYLARHRDQLETIPEEDEAVQLVELGTHCRGAVFFDGMWIKTRELESAVDAIAQSFPGFYFGRFDVRAPSVEEMKKGRGFKVLELNGVTSEATHIYDPSNSLWTAYGALMRQWRIAFRIGAMNRAAGVKVPRLADALREALHFRAAPEA